jgi:predicted ArsR family transcriptional regulator
MSELFDVDPVGNPIARTTDPTTSHAGAKDVEPRRPTHKTLLLREVYRHGALTADEAAEAAGLEHTGYWKRISDLIREGLLTPVVDEVTGDVVTRPGRSGSAQRVLRLTAKGREVVS